MFTHALKRTGNMQCGCKLHVVGFLTSKTRKSNVLTVKAVMDANSTAEALTQACGRTGAGKVI